VKINFSATIKNKVNIISKENIGGAKNLFLTSFFCFEMKNFLLLIIF
jgi:hypothetical protein